MPQNETQTPQESLKFVEQEKQELKTLREQTKTKMKPLLNKKITNKRDDNTQAYITMSGLKEMLSSKSIMQSVKNSFTKEQHIQASQKIHELFEDAIFQNRNIPRHLKPLVESCSIYYADFNNARAVISIQERKTKENIFYFLKLEELQQSGV